MKLAQTTGSAMGQLKEQLKEMAREQLWVLQMGQLKEQLKVRLTVLVWEMLSGLEWGLRYSPQVHKKGPMLQHSLRKCLILR